jgi:hypothetical protein
VGGKDMYDIGFMLEKIICSYIKTTKKILFTNHGNVNLPHENSHTGTIDRRMEDACNSS